MLVSLLALCDSSPSVWIRSCAMLPVVTLLGSSGSFMTTNARETVQLAAHPALCSVHRTTLLESNKIGALSGCLLLQRT